MQALGFLLALFLVGVAGPLAGFRKRQVSALETPVDPLEEQRRNLLLGLKDLESAHASGALNAEEHARLREQSEARIARVLRALEARSQPGKTADAKSQLGYERRSGVPRWAALAVVGAAIAAGTVPSLASSVSERQAGSTFTGTIPGSSSPAAEDPLALFRERVRSQPEDVAARLDLAHRYLDAGRPRDALPEYLAVLELAPDNAEAHAHMGFLLYVAGRPEGGLQAVDRALSADPRYPEALMFKGVILLQGMNNPAAAVEAFRAYLAGAPNGPEADAARRMLAQAEAAIRE